MPVLTLQATSSADTAPPDGLLIDRVHAGGLLRRLDMRGAHYADLHLATGPGWLALFSASSGQADLPWASPSALYLRRLAEGCYCQVGYQPNIPATLQDHLGAYLGQSHGLRAPVALVAGDPVKVYELSRSCRIAEAELTALELA